MKTIEQVEAARLELRRKIVEENPDNNQRLLLYGMLNALVWVADGPDCTTMNRVMAGEPLAKKHEL